MTTQRIRTTHTGSLPRPEAVLTHLAEKQAGQHVDAAAGEALLSTAVGKCVDRQIAAGVERSAGARRAFSRRPPPVSSQSS